MADGTVLDWLSTPAYVRWARARIDAGRAAAGRTDAHRLTVFTCVATGHEAAFERALAERRAQGDAAVAFLDAPPGDLALTGDPDAQRASLAALAAAGADSVVLVSPDPRAPLDPGALAHLLAA